MKSIRNVIAVSLVPLTLVFATGCDTTTGALSGAGLGAAVGAIADHGHPGAGALIGAGAGALAGGIIGTLNAQQKAQLQQQSPQTLQTLQHNDQVAKQQAAQAQNPPPAPAPGQPAAPAQPEEAPIPLKVDDIKAMNAAGIKPDAIIQAIKESKTTYTADDLSAAQQASPPLDPTVIAYMKSPTA